MVAITRKKFTLDEYHRLIDWGFFAQNEKVELIRGEIIQISPKRTPHSVCNSLLWKAMYDLIDKQAEIRVQEPIIIDFNSEPEPDLVIAVNKNDNYLSSHPSPGDILLVIEIADSTLKYDQDTKLALYAEAKINNYWIVNLVERHLEAYRQPFQDNQGQFAYRSKQIILADETIELPHFNSLDLDLSQVFPK
ncbi:MAG: Uma2 family endonuclease [Cyanobacteria bacterium P01_A01_bin.40]